MTNDYGYNQAEICWGDSSINEANVRKVLQGIRDIGGSRVRMAVQLGTLADTDRAMNLAQEYGIKPLPCLINNPSFGYDGSVSGFAKMCKAIAQRYGPTGTGQVTEYELFNEANSSLNAPGGASAATFTQFIKAGYTEIKAIHTSSTVIAGGTIPAPDTWIPFIGQAINPVDWYRGIYAAGGKNYFDAAGFHLYADVPPSPTMAQWKYMTDIRDLMVLNGDTDKKVWVTEVGVGFPQTGITSLAQARDWLKIMVEGIESYPWCGPFFIYNYRNCTTNANDPNSVYGMVDYNFQPKTPMYEYALTIRGTGTLDVTPPTSPANLTYTDLTSSSVALTWSPSTDDVSVTIYRVYANGVKVAETSATSITLSSLLPGTPYTVYVTAVDGVGHESVASSTKSFTTAAPSGTQALFSYDFTPTGSTLPMVFNQLGVGFAVAGGVALPVPPTVDGAYYTIAPYLSDQQSPDHSAEIAQSTASAYVDRFAMPLARMSPDGTAWIGATITGGGMVDACKILTFDNGTLTTRTAKNASPLLPGEKLRLTANGNVYTASRIGVDGVLTNIVSWIDLNNVYVGATYRRAGLGWRHKRVGGVNYAPPGITGLWRSIDLSAIQTFGGVADTWMLGITPDDDWPVVIATGLWEISV